MCLLCVSLDPAMVRGFKTLSFLFPWREQSGPEGYRGWPLRRSGQNWHRTKDNGEVPAFLPGPARRKGVPPFLYLPRFIPDKAGPCFVSHASLLRSWMSKDTVSFHFQLCQMVLLCNQIWMRPRIDPESPSDLMTFLRTLFSLIFSLAWRAILHHPDVPWGWNSTGKAPGRIVTAAFWGARGRLLWRCLSFLPHCHYISLTSGSRGKVHWPFHSEKVRYNQ